MNETINQKKRSKSHVWSKCQIFRANYYNWARINVSSGRQNLVITFLTFPACF